MQPKDKAYRVFLEGKIRELESHISELEARLWEYDNDIDLIIYDKVKNVDVELARRSGIKDKKKGRYERVHDITQEPHILLVRFKNNTIHETLTCNDRRWYNLWEWWSRDTLMRKNIDLSIVDEIINRWRCEDAENNNRRSGKARMDRR